MLSSSVGFPYRMSWESTFSISLLGGNALEETFFLLADLLFFCFFFFAVTSSLSSSLLSLSSSFDLKLASSLS